MNSEQKAIIAAAEKEGVPACERDARLVVYSMVKATRAAMAKYEVGLNKMTEKQQDAVNGDLETAYKDLALTIARAMASAGTPSVVMNCSDLKIAKGVFTGTVKADQQFFNELISKVQDKSEVVVVLYERQYADALDAIESDKDQRSLPLGTDQGPAEDKPAKPGSKTKGKSVADVAASIALDPAMMEKASKFITDVKTPTIAGIQNVLSIGFQKAEAVLAELARKGEIVEEEDGTYRMPPTVAAEKPLTKKQQAAADKLAEGAGNPGDEPEAEGAGLIETLTDEIYEAIKAGVIEKQSVAKIAITIKHGVTDEVADDAIDRMELDGIISDMDELGGRVVFEQPA